MNKSPINAVGLIRVSTAGQADEARAGIPSQRESIRRLAEQHGLTITRIFELKDVSGARVLLSLEYQEFLRMLERTDVSAVAAKEFSRFMRPERFEDYAILQHFADNGITLYMPDGVIDLSNSQSKFFASIRAGMAGLERQDIRDRMMGGKEAMRRQGRHPSGLHTLARGIGYDKKAGWYYDEEEIGPVRLLFQSFLSGNHSYARLAELTGIPRTTVPVTLKNPVYAGTMTYRTKHDLSPSGAYPSKGSGRVHRRKIQRREDEVIEVKLPLEPIVTPEQHRYIASIIESQRSIRYEIRKRGQAFTYRGFLRCAACRQPIYTHVSGASKLFYCCKSKCPRYRRMHMHLKDCTNRYMSQHLLEPKLDEALFRRLGDHNFLARQIEQHFIQAQKRRGGVDPELVASRIEALEAKRRRIINLFEDGDIERSEKTDRLESINRERDQLQALRAGPNVETPGPGQMIEVVRVFREWPFLQMAAKRKLLSELVPEIFVHRYVVGGVALRIPGCGFDNLPKKEE